MKKNKTLLLTCDYTLINELKEESNITFLFPIKDFTVGFPKTFQLNELDTDCYIFVNRILDNEGITLFKTFLKNLPSNIKGIVFDDIGVLNVLINENINITKILFLNHLNCNYESINSYLEYVDSVIPSVDITTSELDEILSKAIKPLVLYTFGHVNIMYSRRTLITNYNKHFNSDVKSVAHLVETQNKHELKITQNKYGTVIYTDKPFNGLNLRFKSNVLYNLINTVFLSKDEVIKIIKSTDNLDNIYPYKYLSEKETIYKLKEGEN